MPAPVPTITVCIVAHRLDLLFRRAIHSVSRQLTPPDEVVLVIDGFSWKMKDEKIFGDIPSDWKIVWTENENSGPSMPRNTGMYSSTSDWILILDGDDFLVPSCIDAYMKVLPHITSEIVAEFQVHSLVHQGLYVTKNMPPDRNSWNDVVRSGTKFILSSGWRRGDLPIRPFIIRNENKKYYPIDFFYLEDKALLFYYMMEERRILLSDYCGYVRNIHPKSFSSSLLGWGISSRDESRIKKIANNININNWTLRDKIFDPWKSHLYLTDDDRSYIDESVKYFSSL